MRTSLFAVTLLMVTPTFTFSQTDTTTDSQAKPAKQRSHTTITGCLSNIGKSGKSSQYRLRDEKGKTVIPYSSTVNLDSYVGQSVTVVGDQSAMPSTDTGTGRPMPHFKVLEVDAASGTCK
jgi:hypothetical protein